MPANGTFLMRIQTLEKRLDEYQSRLNLEEKRRQILEDWIRLNFDFEVQHELENATVKIKKRKPRSAKPIAKSKSSSSNSDVQTPSQTFANSTVGNSSFYQSNEDTPEANFIEIRSSPGPDSTESDSDTGDNCSGDPLKRTSSGRPKKSIWNSFRTERNPDNPKRDLVFCKRCESRVSPQAGRMQAHLKKCKGNNGKRDEIRQPKLHLQVTSGDYRELPPTAQVGNELNAVEMPLPQNWTSTINQGHNSQPDSSHPPVMNFTNSCF